MDSTRHSRLATRDYPLENGTNQALAITRSTSSRSLQPNKDGPYDKTLVNSTSTGSGRALDVAYSTADFEVVGTSSGSEVPGTRDMVKSIAVDQTLDGPSMSLVELDTAFDFTTLRADMYQQAASGATRARPNRHYGVTSDYTVWEQTIYRGMESRHETFMLETTWLVATRVTNQFRFSRCIASTSPRCGVLSLLTWRVITPSIVLRP